MTTNKPVTDRARIIGALDNLDCVMVEICEPHPANPSPNIIPVERSVLRDILAGQSLGDYVLVPREPLESAANLCFITHGAQSDLGQRLQNCLATPASDSPASHTASICEICDTPEMCLAGRWPCTLSGEFIKPVPVDVANQMLARDILAGKSVGDARVLTDPPQIPPFLSAPTFDDRSEERVCINGCLYLRADFAARRFATPSSDSPAIPEDAFAWLIEAPGANYLGVREIGLFPEFHWTNDHNKALRFYSKEQADLTAMAVRRMEPQLWAFAVTLGEAWPREHKWISGDTPKSDSPAIPETWRCPNCHVRFSRVDDVDAHLASLPTPASHTAPDALRFQDRVQPWMMECFGAEIASDVIERNDRFIEEALELVQANCYTADRAHALVEYVFRRPVGEPAQEVGGVMVTLAALCLAAGLDMHDAGETELARIKRPEIVEKIRAKQAAKPTGSALPIATPAPSRDEVERLTEKLLQFALRCSSSNPASLGSAVNDAESLLIAFGIEPRERGVFWHTDAADLADARSRLAALNKDSGDVQ